MADARGTKIAENTTGLAACTSTSSLRKYARSVRPGSSAWITAALEPETKYVESTSAPPRVATSSPSGERKSDIANSRGSEPESTQAGRWGSGMESLERSGDAAEEGDGAGAGDGLGAA